MPKESDTLLPTFQRKKEPKNIVGELNRLLAGKDKIISKKLFKRYFEFQSLIDMQKELYKTKNTDKNKNLVNVIKNGLPDL